MRLVRVIWSPIERLLRCLLGIRPVRRGGVIGVAIRRWRGPELSFPGGEAIRPGDAVVEVHIDNLALEGALAAELAASVSGSPGAGACSEAARVLAMRRVFSRDLSFLAGRWFEDPGLRACTGLVGLTVLHRGASAVGFTVGPEPGGLAGALVGSYMRFLMALFHPGGVSRLGRGRDHLRPRTVFMTARMLLERYGGAGAGPAVFPGGRRRPLSGARLPS